jgi:hypothetical protein
VDGEGTSADGTSGGPRAGAAAGPRGGGVATLGPGPLEDAPEGATQMTAQRKWPGTVAMTRTTVPDTNDRLRLSWRMTEGNVEAAVEPSYRGS